MVEQGIVRAIVNVAVFLEFSDDSTVNEDASVEAMEQLAADLQSVSEQTRTDLVSAIKNLAPQYQVSFQEFIMSLPESLGLE